MKVLFTIFASLIGIFIVVYNVTLEDSQESVNLLKSQGTESTSESVELTESYNKKKTKLLLNNEISDDKVVSRGSQQAIVNREHTHRLDNNEQVMLDNLYSEEGLSDAGAEKLFHQTNFDDFIYSLEKSETKSYETQSKFEEIITNSELNKNNQINLTAFNCDDTVCMGALSFESEEFIEQFINDTFRTNNIAASFIAQPVSINGSKEMRIIFNYSNPTIVISNGSS